MEEDRFEEDEGLLVNENEVNHDSSTEFKEKPIPLYKIPFPGKWKKYYDTRHFKKEWHDMYPWIEEDPNDPRSAVCRVCNKQVRAHKSVLEAHQRTKKHLRKLSGDDTIEEDDEEQKPIEVKVEDYQPQVKHPPDVENERLEPIIVDNQLAYFTESAHNAVENIIDGLVEKYHENRIENLQIENEVKMQVQAQRAALTEARKQHRFNQNIQSQMYKQQELDFKLQLLQHQQEITLNSMEKELDLKLKATEQQLSFSRHLYEKNVKLLDEQLQLIK